MQGQISKKVLNYIKGENQALWSYLTNMACSGVLTTIAFLTNSIPVLIGAMVVAPVLTPLQLISFGLASGHLKLALKGIYLSLFGLLLASTFAALTAVSINYFDVLEASSNLLEKPLLEERTRPGIYSVLVGISAGVAGCLAMAKQKIDALVGVVSSVALVPALGAASIALISGDVPRMIGALTLFLINYLTIVGSSILVLALLGKQISKEESAHNT